MLATLPAELTRAELLAHLQPLGWTLANYQHDTCATSPRYLATHATWGQLAGLFAVDLVEDADAVRAAARDLASVGLELKRSHGASPGAAWLVESGGSLAYLSAGLPRLVEWTRHRVAAARAEPVDVDWEQVSLLAGARHE